MKTFNQFVSGFFLNDFLGICKKERVKVDQCGIDPEDLSYLLGLNYIGVINKDQTKQIISNRIKRKKMYDYQRASP
jgi:Asp-tRNA(Asn)/Glu-tRNA(Gln) amidotransferase B subunit